MLKSSRKLHEQEKGRRNVTGASALAILVIDDDKAIRDTLRLALEDSHYQVHEADDGNAGLAAVMTSNTPLVVLLDQFMPHLDGVGMLTKVVANSATQVPHGFILMTASPQTLPSDMSAFGQSLLLRLMPKPFDIDKLLDTVAEVAQQIQTR